MELLETILKPFGRELDEIAVRVRLNGEPDEVDDKRIHELLARAMPNTRSKQP